MAILPILDRKETKAIMKAIEEKPRTAKELNEIVVMEKSLCSTSSLYRRLSELMMAAILEKEEVYRLTEYGKTIVKEMEKETIPKIEVEIIKAIRVLNIPSTVEIQQQMNISPNKLVLNLKKMEEDGLLDMKKEKKGKGRPSKKYSVTKKGKEKSSDYEELKKKVKR
jgi:DNA-binding HxlR family transcriptional regulator